MIRDQLELLRQNLMRCKETIGNSAVDAKLRERVSARFDKQLAQLEARHKTLKEKATNGQPLEPCWRELSKLQRDSDKVFGECLVFIHGALARKAGLDEEICSFTDKLLDDLAIYSDVSWGRFTLLATSEFYLDTAEIIRVRYPEVSLWSLPLATHEFGHYLGPQLRESKAGQYAYPFQEILKTADEKASDDLHTQNWYHLQEHFADLFATYALGPAYAAAFIMLRMNPAESQDNLPSHPSAARRVHGILWVLDKMDDLQPAPRGRPFHDVTARLRNTWQNSLRETGNAEKLADVEASLTDQRMAQLLELLTGNTPPRLMFGGADWARAQQMAEQWITGMPAIAIPPDGLTRRDVLNGAWLARLQVPDQSPYAVNAIATQALAEYRQRPEK
jgi:hypothetical protein